MYVNVTMRFKQTKRDKAEEKRRIAASHPELLKTKTATTPEKEQSTMSKSTKWTIVITATLTVLVAVAFVYVFYLGTQFQQHINEQIITESHNLTHLKK